MRREAGLCGVLLGLAAACAGGAREPEAGAGDACAAGKTDYAERRQQVLERLAASGCKVDTDCGVLWESNGCVNTCGVTVPNAGMEAAGQELQSYARTSCGSCPPIPTPPCAPPGPVVCQAGRCAQGQ
jgi:hypothetical protein